MMDQLTTILHEDGPEEVIEQAFRGMEPKITARSPMEYRCYCSRERVRGAIATVGTDALKEMIADGKSVEVSCQFCDAVYHFTTDELQSMLDEVEA
jgi:Disulfide bond chaperones of the HSP33 family